MRNFKKLNSIVGVAAGASVSMNLPIGLTYDHLFFALSGVTPAQIKNVRLELNGRLVTEYKTLQQLVDENKYYQRVATDSMVTWPFIREELKGGNVVNANGVAQAIPDLTVQRYFALGTTGLSTAQIKFDIDTAATTPSITPYAITSAPSPVGFLTKRRSIVVNLNNGITEIADLPRPANSKIAAIHLKGVGIQGAELKIDGTKWREVLPKALHDHILLRHKRTKQTNTHHMDFILDGDLANAITLDRAIQDFRLTVEATASGQCEIIVEYLDQYSASGF